MSAQNRRKIRIDGRQNKLVETGRSRIALTTVIFAAAFAVLSARLVWLGIVSPDAAASIARVEAGAPPVRRADIVDRNGKVLARGLSTFTLYAFCKDLMDPQGTAASLARILPDLKDGALAEKITDCRGNVRLMRHLTPRQKYRVITLGLPGLYFLRQERRFYARGRAASHVIGYTDTDNHGLAGIEKRFEEQLTKPENLGHPLELSIDVRLQQIVERELAVATEEFNGVAASAVLMNALNGEILAVASVPNFDPHRPMDASDLGRFSQATLGVYELGSVFKTFTVAMALDAGCAHMGSRYDVRQKLKYGRFKIGDSHPKNRVLTLPEVYAYSSNIGAAKIARDCGTKVQQDYLRRLGLLDPAPLELLEVGHPQVPDRWREINTLTIGFGHGIAVSPLQVAAGIAPIVNGGYMVKPTLLKQEEHPGLVQVLKSGTSARMRDLMRLVVTSGTGRRADTVGYPVIGKTGTAEKRAKRGKGYSKKRNISSFVGAFPADQPTYVIYVVMDEARGNDSTKWETGGGLVAAPVVQSIVSQAGPILGIAPRARQEEDITMASFE